MVATIILSVAVFILAETVGVLAYTIYKMKKSLNETSTNLDNLANCVLQLARHTSGIDIVEDVNTQDIKFPNSEGF